MLTGRPTNRHLGFDMTPPCCAISWAFGTSALLKSETPEPVLCFPLFTFSFLPQNKSGPYAAKYTARVPPLSMYS